MPREASVKEMAGRKPILTPYKQRVLWARVSALKRILVKHGLVTHEEFEDMVTSMVNDIDQKVEQNMRKEVGLEEKEDQE